MNNLNQPNEPTNKTKCGQELSPIFIGVDGKLSVMIDDNECEIVGYRTTIFFHSFLYKEK